MANTPVPAQQAAHPDGPHAHKHVAPGYVLMILAAITIFEVIVTVATNAKGDRVVVKETLIPMLLALSFVKAMLVALYYMHLRYEKFIYGFAFVVPSLFALLLLSVLMSR